MYKLIDGKEISLKVKREVKEDVAKLKNSGIDSCLAVIIVGQDPASRVYVNNKKKACEFTGIKSIEYALDADTTEEQLLSLIDELNNNDDVNGILCQLPVPKHIDDTKVIERIDPRKDVDTFSAINVGKLWVGDYKLAPCTPAGVMELLKAYDVDLCGKNCVIVGRSNIVGKPMAALLLEKNATVTICHSKTKDLKKVCLEADVIVAAVGRANFITTDMVKQGAVVVDVGINRLESGKLCGDVDFENVKEKSSLITPVPGGCGPMTIAMLMKNTVIATRDQNNL